MALDAVGNIFIDASFPSSGGGSEPPQPPGNPPGGEDREKPQIPKKENNAFEEGLEEINATFGKTLDPLLAIVKYQKDSKMTAETQESFIEKIAGTNATIATNSAGEKISGPKGKRRDKVEEYFMKKMVAADFFTKVGGWLKGIAKSTANFIIDLIKFLAIFALFGPEFLDAIISFVLNFVIMIVNMFIAVIPTIVAAIAKFLPIVIQAAVKAILTLIPILAREIPKLIKILAGAIKDIIKGIAQILPVLIPALLDVLKAVIEGLAEILPIVVDALVKGATLLIDELIKLFQDEKFINTMIESFVKIIEALVVAAPIIINAIIKLIPLLYDAVIKMFDELGKKFTFFKVVAGYFRILKFVVMGIIDFISGLVDQWKKAKNAIDYFFLALKYVFSFQFFLVSLLMPLAKKLKTWFFHKFIDPMVSWFTKMGNDIIDSVMKFVNRVKNMFSFQNIKAAVQDAFAQAGLFLLNIIKDSKNYFFNIMDRIGDYINAIIAKMIAMIKVILPGTTDEDRAIAKLSLGRAVAVSRLARETGVDSTKLLAAAGGDRAAYESLVASSQGAIAADVANKTEDQLSTLASLAQRQLDAIRESGQTTIPYSAIQNLR